MKGETYEELLARLERQAAADRIVHERNVEWLDSHAFVCLDYGHKYVWDIEVSGVTCRVQVATKRASKWARLWNSWVTFRTWRGSACNLYAEAFTTEHAVRRSLAVILDPRIDPLRKELFG